MVDEDAIVHDVSILKHGTTIGGTLQIQKEVLEGFRRLFYKISSVEPALNLLPSQSLTRMHKPLVNP